MKKKVFFILNQAIKISLNPDEIFIVQFHKWFCVVTYFQLKKKYPYFDYQLIKKFIMNLFFIKRVIFFAYIRKGVCYKIGKLIFFT